MGGYPALMIKQPESPLQGMAQAQQVVAGGQQIQEQRLQMQQQQQAITDQHALTTAMTQWDGKDYRTLPMQVLKAGGSGNAAMQMTQTMMAMKEKASTIAKDDSITAQNNAKVHIDNMDEARGKLLATNALPIEQRQQKWDEDVTQAEQNGLIQPNQIPHQYPGEKQATALANTLALGSKLQQESLDHQKMALEAWKPVGGQLVNAITGERIGGIANVNQINKGLETRYQVLHPGEALPEQFKLSATATPQDFDRVDKLLEATERGTATKAQQEMVNAMRMQTFEMQRDKTDQNPVTGIDPKTGAQVLVPAGQAQQMGIQNAMKADADLVNKSMAARHWLNLANSQAPDKAPPAEKGIMQLVDELDKEGKLGPLASRYNDFMAGKWGAGDPEYAALRAKMGLSTTLLMQAHVGSRGSAQMLEHFEDLANAKKLDGPTLKAALGAEVNYVQDRAMDPNPPDYSKGKGAAPAAKAAPTAVPANVTKALANTGTGRHTLSDGSIWDKHADGTVVKAND